MKKMLAIPLVALAACAPMQPAELNVRGQNELTAALQGLSAGQPVACVSQRNLRGSRSIGDGAILFEGHGNLVYVNRPPAGCPSLGGGRTLVTSTPGTQLCRGDIVSVVDVPSNMQFGACGLGDFTPYRRLR